jgi:hypothetical protein
MKSSHQPVKRAALSSRFILGRVQIQNSVILSEASRNYFTRSTEQPDDDYDDGGGNDDHDDDNNDDDNDNYNTGD